eukprot:CAMPEP_0197877758 /NCGR_PEP_ID=MMETSP1439-20131203/6345_1 /TAXON_ID=66791 /ORGANISM="Gonyaulax spinifera, Strain CCMP409" /LENGTH=458 /DNA_ID=CAMNT_0043497129 /DNA_START=97 /DNA_END=1473 /DNA_ORIENTATION=+
MAQLMTQPCEALFADPEDGQSAGEASPPLLGSEKSEGTIQSTGWATKRLSFVFVLCSLAAVVAFCSSRHGSIQPGNPLDYVDLAASSTRALELTIISAEGLPDEDWHGDSDPYVKAHIVGNPLASTRTKTVDDNEDPEWNSKAVLSDYRPGDAIQFQVFDEDTTTDDDLGGAKFTPDCASPGTQTLKLSKSGHLKVDVKCVDAAESKLLSMVKIADYVYDLYPSAGPWDMVAHFEHKGDKVAIYKSDSECTLAFSGTDDLDDIGTDLNVATTEQCGYSLHKGFFNELSRLMQVPEWKDTIEPYLASEKCSGGVNAAGHSLGGALASIFATCANRKEDLISGNKFIVKELYTVGAPGVAKQPLEDKQRPSHCFNGARLFNEDPNTFDPVPYVAKVAGFVHPKLKATQIIEHKDHTLVTKDFDAKSTEAHRGLSGGVALAVLHSADVYLRRASSLFNHQG